MGRRACRRSRLEPARKRDSLVDQRFDPVTEICSSHEVTSQEMTNLGFRRVLRSRCIWIHSRNNEFLGSLDSTSHREVRRANSSCMVIALAFLSKVYLIIPTVPWKMLASINCHRLAPRLRERNIEEHSRFERDAYGVGNLDPNWLLVSLKHSPELDPTFASLNAFSTAANEVSWAAESKEQTSQVAR